MQREERVGENVLGRREGGSKQVGWRRKGREDRSGRWREMGGGTQTRLRREGGRELAGVSGVGARRVGIGGFGGLGSRPHNNPSLCYAVANSGDRAARAPLAAM